MGPLRFPDVDPDRELEPAHLLPEAVGIDAQVQERSENHVAAQSRGSVQVHEFHAFVLTEALFESIGYPNPPGLSSRFLRSRFPADSAAGILPDAGRREFPRDKPDHEIIIIRTESSNEEETCRIRTRSPESPGRYRNPRRHRVSMRSTASGMSARSRSTRPSAARPTPTSPGRWRASASPSSAATAGATGSCPAEINYRANAYGFKMLGVRRVISVNSVGSLREEIRPRDIVLADQFIDRTRRTNTFFGEGVVAHIGFARPVCPDLSRRLCAGRRRARPPHAPRGDLRLHRRPRFFDRRRIQDLPVLGLRRHRHDRRDRGEALPRGRDLLRDAQPGHRLRRLARRGGDPSASELILENLRHNIDNAKAIIRKTVAALLPAGSPRPPAAAARRSGTRSSPTPRSSPGDAGKARPHRRKVPVALSKGATHEPRHRRFAGLRHHRNPDASAGKRSSAGPGPIAPWPPAFSPRPQGRRRRRPGFPPKRTLDFPASRKIDLKGVSSEGREDLPLGRPLRRGPEPADDRAGPTSTSSPISSPSCPPSYRSADILYLANIDPDLHGSDPDPGPEAAARGHGHDPLLDRDQAGRRLPGARAGRHLLRQRRGSQAPGRRHEPGPGRARSS